MRFSQSRKGHTDLGQLLAQQPIQLLQKQNQKRLPFLPSNYNHSYLCPEPVLANAFDL
eukprot:COSAG06_NODE_9891_length_1795_cov_10.794222_3_plen_58_part_00